MVWIIKLDYTALLFSSRDVSNARKHQALCTSSWSLLGPNEMRTAPSLSTPMAFKTWLWPVLPEEHADPEDTARPARSNAIFAVWLTPESVKKLVLLSL